MGTITFGLSICFLGNMLFAMESSADLTKSISQFSSELYSKASEGQTSNIILSPFSIHMAVSLAYMGANGKTADEMKTGLKLQESKEKTAEQINELIKPLQNNTMLKVANKVYVMESYHVTPFFNDIARTKFHSESETVDFARTVESAGKINRWVEDHTNKKIQNLISPDSLSSDTRMVLVNAIYFKGFWEHKFITERTKKEKFYTNDKDSIDVDMMHVKEHFRYGEFQELDAKGIELPYKDSDMSMFIILPNSRTGLEKLERDLRNRDIHELSKNMFRTEVEVSLPKFKIEFELSLVDTLKKMGMVEMFGNNADFSGLIDGHEPLSISDVVHKAFIDVNEEGSEAAAATGAFMMLTCMPEEFVVDHSFLFFIWNNKNHQISFLGKFMA